MVVFGGQVGVAGVEQHPILPQELLHLLLEPLLQLEDQRRRFGVGHLDQNQAWKHTR